MKSSREEESETSAFTSNGRKDVWPPIYEDSKDMSFVDEEGRWPTKKLLGRLAIYEEFLKRDDPMPRARNAATRIKDHIIFELLVREGYFEYLHDLTEEDDG